MPVKKALFVLLVLALPACAEINADLDCGAVCESQRSCVEVGVDRVRCRSRCEVATDEDRDFRNAVADCSDCVSSRTTCAAVIDRCDAVCAPVRARLRLASVE